MDVKAQVDIECGTYSYQIKKNDPPPPPPQPPALQPQQCHGSNDFGSHGDINGATQNVYTGFACAGSALKSMKAGDPPVIFQTDQRNVPYHYQISWIDDCKTTADSQNLYIPLASDTSVTCMTLLRQDYEKCKRTCKSRPSTCTRLRLT
jgi:hypothetical protein